MTNIFRRLSYFKSSIKVNSIEEVKESWDKFSPNYNRFDYCMQTFYYTLVNMMKLQSSTNILEVACGTGKLLPLMLQFKPTTTPYLASDLSINQVVFAKEYLQKHFERYQSVLSFTDWCQKQNLEFDVINAEEPIHKDILFDRIICNLVLMLTTDPLKMLKNLHAHSKPGCLLGVSIMGDQAKTNFVTLVSDSVKECGFQLPSARSNFHLYQKIPDLAAQTGWQIVINWEQNAPMCFFDLDNGRNMDVYSYLLSGLPESQRFKVRNLLQQKVEKTFEEKRILNFSVQLLILKRIG